ncbi:MAG: hypothetical protein J0I06_20205 [Planctomycetes bacterium]|nr:hypothetical protein [Planctomycetota bacterium]
MPALRAIVSTTDRVLRERAAAVLAEAGCEVRTADSGVGCVEQARASAPDLLVLLPPLLWGSVAGVLAVLHEDPGTWHVPVLILAQPFNEGSLPCTPRLVLTGPVEGTGALPSLIDRVRTRMRELVPAPSGR